MIRLNSLTAALTSSRSSSSSRSSGSVFTPGPPLQPPPLTRARHPSCSPSSGSSDSRPSPRDRPSSLPIRPRASRDFPKIAWCHSRDVILAGPCHPPSRPANPCIPLRTVMTVDPTGPWCIQPITLTGTVIADGRLDCFLTAMSKDNSDSEAAKLRLGGINRLQRRSQSMI